MKTNKIKDILIWCMATQKISDNDFDSAKAELAELERLAEIGRATEKAFDYSKNNKYTIKTILILDPDIEVCDCEDNFESIEELLSWAKED